MEIVFNHLYKLDLEANDTSSLNLPNEESDLKSYVKELVTNVLESSDRRGYIFPSDTTEIRATIEKILKTEEKEQIQDLTKIIADRLLREEVKAQKRVEKLGTRLLRGVVVISLVKFEDNSLKLIISKTDFDQFLDSLDFTRKDGFPLRKKIYKAFIAAITADNIDNVSVFDTSVITAYWWRDFLELEEVHTDNYNTERAFDVIESKILNPLKKNFKADYIQLWNATVHYFRVKEEYSQDEYADTILRDYEPVDEKAKPKIRELETKARGLATTFNHDGKFKIIKGVIKKRFKKSIDLTPDIELNIKNDVFEIEKVIQSREEPDGSKWVMIKSDTGYEYFKGNQANLDEN